MSSARARKAPVTSGVGSRSSSIMSTDGAGTSSAVSNVASPVSSTSRLVRFLQTWVPKCRPKIRNPVMPCLQAFSQDSERTRPISVKKTTLGGLRKCSSRKP